MLSSIATTRLIGPGTSDYPTPSNFPLDRFPTGNDIRTPFTTGLATAIATADAPFYLPTPAARPS